MRRAVLTIGMLGLVFSLAGCYESSDVTRFEPGKYKGQNDPLLEMLEEPELRAQLDERFDGQRDR